VDEVGLEGDHIGDQVRRPAARQIEETAVELDPVEARRFADHLLDLLEGEELDLRVILWDRVGGNRKFELPSKSCGATTLRRPPDRRECAGSSGFV